MLARAGLAVQVIEGAPTPGGGTRTRELTLPGFQHDVCSAVHPMAIGSPFFRSLDLERYGLRWLQPEVALAHPLDDGRAAAARRSIDETAAGLGVDAETYRRALAPLVDEAGALFDAALGPLRFPKHPLLMARLGLQAWKPAARFGKRFQAEQARALFAGVAAHGVLPFEAPASAAIAIMLL